MKVANQPLSHSAAKQLRGELKALRGQQREKLAAIDSAKKLIEEKTQELTPLREKFDSICHAFQIEVVRQFGSKGLADFGATANVFTDANIVEWASSVVAKLNATAKLKTAELESSAKSVSKLDEEIAALEKREAELKTECDLNKNKAEAQKHSFETDEAEWTRKLEEAEVARDQVLAEVKELVAKADAAEVSLEAEKDRLRNKLMIVAEEGRSAVRAMEEETAEMRQFVTVRITELRKDLQVCETANSTLLLIVDGLFA